jgi:hypothetical protein
MNMGNMIRFVPPVTIVIFAVLYIWCASLYPGGSYVDRSAEGFDWVHNYWCHLMYEQSLNGQPNPARPWSIAALGILLAGILTFFFRFSCRMAGRRVLRLLIRAAVTMSLVCTALISSERHDLMTTLASVFGALALLGTIAMLWQNRNYSFTWWGILCIILLGLNNYMYHTGHGIIALPLVQKFTFVVVLVWVWKVNDLVEQRPGRSPKE